MAKFNYRMQNILDVKVKLEEQAKNEYAMARARLTEEEEKKDQLLNKQHAYEQKARELAEERQAKVEKELHYRESECSRGNEAPCGRSADCGETCGRVS